MTITQSPDTQQVNLYHFTGISIQTRLYGLVYFYNTLTPQNTQSPSGIRGITGGIVGGWAGDFNFLINSKLAETSDPFYQESHRTPQVDLRWSCLHTVRTKSLCSAWLHGNLKVATGLVHLWVEAVASWLIGLDYYDMSWLKYSLLTYLHYISLCCTIKRCNKQSPPENQGGTLQKNYYLFQIMHIVSHIDNNFERLPLGAAFTPSTLQGGVA